MGNREKREGKCTGGRAASSRKIGKITQHFIILSHPKRVKGVGAGGRQKKSGPRVGRKEGREGGSILTAMKARQLLKLNSGRKN